MDDEPSDVVRALDEAIQRAGGVGALAEKIAVAPSTPSMWRKRGRVPADSCPAIERETGVPCERLAPGVAWHVVRQSASQSASGSAPSAAVAAMAGGA